MKKIIVPVSIVSVLLFMAFTNFQDTKKYVTKDKDENYEIPAKSLSLEDANELIKMTKITANGTVFFTKTVAKGYIDRKCYRSSAGLESLSETDKANKEKVEKILRKYLKK